MSGHGGQKGHPGWRSNAGAGSSTRDYIFPWGAAFSDADRTLKLFLNLGQHLAPPTNRLYRAEFELMVVNNAVAVDAEGAAERLATTKEANAVAYRLYTNMCACFVLKNQ